MALEIALFTAGTLSDAGTLLALRHQRLRAVRPELPATFEDPAAARAAFETIWQRDGGVAALSGGRMVGYLIGERVLDTRWGRSAWVRFAGCALAWAGGRKT